MLKDRDFPPEFKKYWTMPGLKAAFISEPTPNSPRDCKNCGGTGTLILFLATQGPFDYVPTGKEIIAIFRNGKWWGGKNFEEACPVCHGSGRNPNYVQPPVRQRELILEGVLQEKK